MKKRKKNKLKKELEEEKGKKERMKIWKSEDKC